MKTAVLWALVALNGALLLSFLGQWTQENSARAQSAAMKRPGEYLMIDGSIPGSSSGVVYVVDTVNGQLGAMTFNDSLPGSQIESMPPIDLTSVFAVQPPAASPKPKHGY